MIRSVPTDSPATDSLLREIAAYVSPAPVFDDALLGEAGLCLLDALGNAMLALQDGNCTRWLGSLVPGQTMSFGARVPGTDYELDPATAAANIAFCFRWKGLECQWLGETRVCPSDPAAPLLAVSDWLGRNLWHTGQFRAFGRGFSSRTIPPTMRELLTALVCAQEIQAALAESEVWTRRGYCSGLLARVASGAALCQLLGAETEQIVAALSLAWQGGVLPAGARDRDCWNAAFDAQQSVVFSLRALAGDPGCPGILGMAGIGFHDSCHGSDPVRLARPLGSSAGSQITYNLAHPDALELQAVVEAASRLQPSLTKRLGDIEAIELSVPQAAMAAASDGNGSLPRAVALTLLTGRPQGENLEFSQEMLLRSLVPKIEVHADPLFTADCRDPERRTLPGGILVRFRDGTRTERIIVEYPIGHYKRRREGMPLLYAKAESALASRLDDERVEEIIDLIDKPSLFLAMPVQQFLDYWTV